MARLLGHQARLDRRWVVGLSYLGFLSHPALDWLNNYGVRLLMPFDGTWYYGDTLFIVDVWIWAILGGFLFLRRSRSSRWPALLWTLLAILATAAVVLGPGRGQLPFQLLWLAAMAALVVLDWLRPQVLARPRAAAAALALALVYIFLNRGVTAWAESTALSQMAAGGQEVEKLMASPVPLNFLLRDVVVQTPVGYRFGTFYPLAEPRLRMASRLIPKPPRTPSVSRAFQQPQVCGLVNWARFPWVVVEHASRTDRVYIMDARYRRTPGTGFGGAVVELEAPR